MSTIFLYCASIGGALLVLQFVLLLCGVGGDSDGHGHVHVGGDAGSDAGDGTVGHDQGSWLKLLSVQTVSTFATFFGLVGMTTRDLGWSTASVTGAALLAGAAALLLVARAMHWIVHMQSSGTIDLQNAIGQEARVYLRIPPAGSGHGRVLLPVQGRTIECRAVSRGLELPTGALARVIDRTEDGALVVELRP